MRTTKIFIVMLSCILLSGLAAYAGKIDPCELVKKHGLKNIGMLKSFKRDLPKNPRSHKVKFMDEELFNRVKKLYEETKDLKMEDCLPNLKSIKMVIELSHFETAAEYYFKSRERALSMYEEDARKKQDEEEATKEAQKRLEREASAKEENRKKRAAEKIRSAKIQAKEEKIQAKEEKERERQLKVKEEKSKKSAPQRAATFFKKTPKPKDFAEIKQFVSLRPKVEIRVVEEHYADKNVWRVSSGYHFRDYSSGHWRNHLIFTDIPLSAAPYKNKLMWIGAKIARKLGEYYVITAGPKEALAEISNKILTSKNLKTNTDYVIVSKLKEIATVETVTGSTKQIAVVKVEGIFPSADLDTFKKYIVAHPEEVPPNTHITYEPSSSR